MSNVFHIFFRFLRTCSSGTLAGTQFGSFTPSSLVNGKLLVGSVLTGRFCVDNDDGGLTSFFGGDAVLRVDDDSVAGVRRQATDLNAETKTWIVNNIAHACAETSHFDVI